MNNSKELSIADFVVRTEKLWLFIRQFLGLNHGHQIQC